MEILIARLHLILMKNKTIKIFIKIMSSENITTIKGFEHITSFYERKTKYKWIAEIPREQLKYELNRLKKAGFTLIDKEFQKFTAELI